MARQLGDRFGFENMDKAELVALLKAIRNSLISSEDSKDTCLYICELLNVNAKTGSENQMET